MAISDTIESMYENTENAYDKVQEKGGTIPANKNLQNLASAIDSITPNLQNKSVTITENGTQTFTPSVGYDGLSAVEVTTNVQGGGVSTQSQSIFTGYTAPLTWLDSTNNVFTYESATHNITISGLSGVATITGNGTKSVTVTIDTSSSSDRQTAFTISCTYENETLTYNGIEFHYGSDVASGRCLAVAQTLINDQIGYVFIESASLPLFSSNTASWNGMYSHQIISFDFAKWSEASIGPIFLANCYSFNQPLAIPSSVTRIGNSFLANCYSFNQPLTIPNSVTSIGNSFLYRCYSFNQPLTIPSGVTSIGTYFLYQCYSFNQPLTIPNSVTSIGNNFLDSCYAFNHPLTIPSSVTVIAYSFLSGCRSFNQPLIIPNTVTVIDYSFLVGCTSFNQPLTIPNSVTSIGNNFLDSCSSFNHPLTIPSSVISIGRQCLQNCYSLVYLEYNASAYPTDNYSLSQGINTKTSTDGTGIKVVGTGASGLKSRLPNRTSSPYRKLV